MPRTTRPQVYRVFWGMLPGNGLGRLSCWGGWRVRSHTTSGPAAPTRNAAPLPRLPEPPSLSCRCNIREMPSKVPVKCAIAGCHRRIKMTLAEREELRRVGRENNATAGVVCPVDVKAAFNFEFDDIDIDVPLGELLVEASKETPQWRVMLTLLPGAAGGPDSQSTPRRGDRVI